MEKLSPGEEFLVEFGATLLALEKQEDCKLLEFLEDNILETEDKYTWSILTKGY